MVQAAALNEKITHVLKSYPPEIALPMVRGLVEELSLVCNGSTLVSRLVKVEVGHKIDRAFAFGAYTIFGGVLIVIPGAIHVVSINSKKERDDIMAVIESLKSRLAEVEKAGPRATRNETQAMIDVMKSKFAELEQAINENGSGATDNEIKALIESLKIKFSELEKNAQVEAAPGCEKN